MQKNNVRLILDYKKIKSVEILIESGKEKFLRLKDGTEITINKLGNFMIDIPSIK